MIVVIEAGSSQKQIDHVCSLVREMGMKDNVIQGTERTVVAVIAMIATRTAPSLKRLTR